MRSWRVLEGCLQEMSDGLQSANMINLKKIKPQHTQRFTALCDSVFAVVK